MSGPNSPTPKTNGPRNLEALHSGLGLGVFGFGF